MALKIFVKPEKPRAKPRDPLITVSAARTSMTISKEAMALLEVESNAGCKVLLMADPDTNVWGVGKTGSDDKRGFQVSIGKTGNGRVLGCKVFIDTLRLDAGPHNVTKTSTPTQRHIIVAPFRGYVAPKE